jgi:hypothetical protein
MINEKFLKYLEEDKLTEAFKAGTASKVVEKLGSILSKRIGTMIVFSIVPIAYENFYGSFQGFLGNVGSGDNFLRINFLLDKSDKIYSADFYTKGYSVVPTYTIDLDGLNIVQVVNTIAENFAEDGIITINEKAGRPQDRDPKELTYIIEKFTEDVSSALKELQNKSLTDVFSGSWFKWAKNFPNYAEIKYYRWVKIVKFFLVERGLSNKTFRKRKDGTKERQIEDPMLQAELEGIVEGIKWQEKFDFLYGALEQIDKGRIQSIYLWGNPGCLSGDTVIDISRGNRKATRKYTLAEAYIKFNHICDKKRGISFKYWQKGYATRIRSYNNEGFIEQTEIKNIIESGIKKVFKVTTEDGKTIKATKDHKFMIEGNEYKSLSELSVGDKILIRDNNRPLKKYKQFYFANKEQYVSLKEISSIESVGEEMTYDIEMKDVNQPNFIANGFVVHNSGKSFETKKKLDKLGSAYTIYTGGLRGPDELIRMLWVHKDDEIIVLDDFDDALKNKSQVNILKGALQNQPVREITWVTNKKAWKLQEIPAKFEFTSGIIFISNQGKMDKAIASRSIVIEINMSNSEVMEKIESTLDAYRPEVSMKDKKEVFEYMREISPGVSFVDYRILDNLLVAKQITGNWKKMGLMMIQSVI